MGAVLVLILVWAGVQGLIGLVGNPTPAPANQAGAPNGAAGGGGGGAVLAPAGTDEGSGTPGTVTVLAPTSIQAILSATETATVTPTETATPIPQPTATATQLPTVISIATVTPAASGTP